MNDYEYAQASYEHPDDTGSIGANTPLVETIATGPGLSQSEARRVARATGGIAIGAQSGAKGWRIGGYSPHPSWIVVTLDRSSIIHDGIDRRSEAK